MGGGGGGGSQNAGILVCLVMLLSGHWCAIC